jgi:hypothetical protein
MQKKHIALVIIFNSILAFSFYHYNLKAEVTDISSDLANIIPICKKLDNPNLFQNDLYLNDINNVKYYTPFYVESIRFIAKFTNQNYIQALNILGFLSHFIYGLVWFLLFYLIKKDFWIAFGFSIFFRGIIWPPGMELLGISDLWTIMPRTVFIALIPIPFIIYKINNAKYLYIAAVILGLLVNFHPISGIGSIIIYFALFAFENYNQKKLFSKNSLFEYLFIAFSIIVGMLPYLLTYILNVKPNVSINQELFQEAIRFRINDVFFNSYLFIKSWHRPVFYFFLICFILFYFFDSSSRKKNFKMITFSIFVLFLFSNGITYIENIVNDKFQMNFRFAFQLIRAQKLIIIMMQIGLYLLLFEIVKKYLISNKIKIFVICIYLGLLSFSSAPIIKNIPFIGEDISTFILPNNLKTFQSPKKDNTNILNAYKYINNNTKQDANFYCKDVYFRTATNRSEILDFHAAGMLIEGNQLAYINAYNDFKNFQHYSQEEKLNFLKKKNVNYIVVEEKWNNLNLVYQNSEYFIYKL